MHHIYIVMIECGFKGAKYFHHDGKAKRLADSIGAVAEKVSVTVQDLFSPEFQDVNECFIETPCVQFNII